MTTSTDDAPFTPHWKPINAEQRRVLGVLIEKAKTTPAGYPMTVNAIVTGCNQKSNRDPAMSLDDWNVERILEELRADWADELESMRLRMLDLRRGLANALRRETNSDRFDFVEAHRGMFSLMGAGPETVKALRDDHGIYMVGDSRVNIAGLPADGLDRLARAIVAAGV